MPVPFLYPIVNLPTPTSHLLLFLIIIILKEETVPKEKKIK
jgi:hypothetical protein